MPSDSDPGTIRGDLCIEVGKSHEDVLVLSNMI